MTFKEQLKNDIEPLVLSEEFKNALSEKMANEKKPHFNLNAAKICLSAAALCLLGFGAFKIANVGVDLFSSSSTDTAANLEALSDGSADDETWNGIESYFADDSGDAENYSKSAELPETAAAAAGGYAANFQVEAINCADENYCSDETDNCEDTAITSEAISTNFGEPIYNGGIICAVQNTYSTDRPWYAAEEMANIVVEKNYRLARVRFGETLTDEEKSKQPVINSGFEGTYYHAEVDGESAVVYFFGSEETQELGNPIYGEGDEIYCALEENGGVYLIREYPLGDIYSFNGEEFIYLRIQACELNAAQLLSRSIEVITTTEGNPARYYSAYPLADFIGEFTELTNS